MKKYVVILIIWCLLTSATCLIFAKQLDDSRQLTDAYKKQLIAYDSIVFDTPDCSPLGFCVGDKVTSNRHALNNKINIYGTVVKISGEILTIDETGYEDFRPINEAWVKHDYMVQPTESTTQPVSIDIEVVDIILV